MASENPYLQPVVIIALIILSSVLVLLGAAIFDFDKGRVLSRMSQPEFARGLITYLFAIVTIGTAVVLVVFVLEGTEGTANETRFQRGKEILSLLLGVFGTIVGFYFGSEVSAKARGQGQIMLLPLRLSAQDFTPGGNLTVTTAATGGTAPYKFGVVFGDQQAVARTVPADESGWISQEMNVPANATGDSLILKTEVEDAVGNVAQRTTKVPIRRPKSP